MSLDKHAIEEMLDQFSELAKSAERNLTVNELLTNYIAYFHEEMAGLSDRMGKKTEELFNTVTELIGHE